jgi:hypothetical protein
MDKIQADLYTFGSNWLFFGFLWGALAFSVDLPWWVLVAMQIAIIIPSHYLLRWYARWQVKKWHLLFSESSESSASQPSSD